MYMFHSSKPHCVQGSLPNVKSMSCIGSAYTYMHAQCLAVGESGLTLQGGVGCKNIGNNAIFYYLKYFLSLYTESRYSHVLKNVISNRSQCVSRLQERGPHKRFCSWPRKP